MKAVIEKKNGVYLIKVYGSDNTLVDILAIEELHFSENLSKASKKGGKK